MFDNTIGSYIDQSNSGYIWDSGTVSCPGGAGTLPQISSPPLTGSVRSLVGGSGYDLFESGHSYRFTFFLGCTGDAELPSGSSGSTLSAGCNIGSASPGSSTFVENGIVFT